MGDEKECPLLPYQPCHPPYAPGLKSGVSHRQGLIDHEDLWIQVARDGEAKPSCIPEEYIFTGVSRTWPSSANSTMASKRQRMSDLLMPRIWP